jgi:hypothetical protein
MKPAGIPPLLLPHPAIEARFGHKPFGKLSAAIPGVRF